MCDGSKDEIELMKKRAIAFLEVAKYSLKQGNYDVTAFNAEQAAQLYWSSLVIFLKLIL